MLEGCSSCVKGEFLGGAAAAEDAAIGECRLGEDEVKETYEQR